MPSPTTLDGKTLFEAIASGTRWLEANVAAVDALNVFPVPDGDTGTNMLLTMRAAVAEAERSPTTSVAATAQSLAHGALLGARGNSGVILSQILRGIAEGLSDSETADGGQIAIALGHGADRAYLSVAKPVEGTILTVIRIASEVATENGDTSVTVALDHACAGAQYALESTPDLLPVLKQAGVVDSGGQGLVLLLEGAVAYLKGEPLTQAYASLGEISRQWLAEVATQHQSTDETAWGYCTEFLLQDHVGSETAVREQIASFGNSLLIVSDGSSLRVHVHTQDPGAVLTLAVSLGTLHKVKIDNMQEQQAALINRSLPQDSPALPVVAVVAGDGLAAVFRSMGASAIISGGQTMNPSTSDIVAAVERFDRDAVIVLPNNANIIASCQQAQQLTSKRIVVIPTRTAPQGIAALLALRPGGSIDENIEAMTEGVAAIHTIEITTASRDATVEDVTVKLGQYVCLLDEKLVASSGGLPDVFNATLDMLNLSRGTLITLYYGEDVAEPDAGSVADALRSRPDAPDVEVVRGGQPHYHYIASVES